MTTNPLLAKTLLACLMAALLLIPLNMIESKIAERQALQRSVQQEIARSSSGPQTINGPYLVLKYRVRLHKTTKDNDGNEKTTVSESATREKLIPPHLMKIEGSADVGEPRNRGIYHVQLFNLQSTIAGDFVVPAGYGINTPSRDIIPESAHFVIGVSDSRGILNVPILTLNADKLEFSPGSASAALGNGISARLQTPDLGQAHTYHFELPFNLQGMSRLAIVPAADSTEMSLKSGWPHPSFGGDFLPRTRNVSAHGFDAHWAVTSLARNATSGDESRLPGAPESFSVAFIDPVNVYLMSQRAVKYGVLFVVLVFTSFFVFEILRGLRIHPLQYLLVGVAMILFFLLIISLSEHIPFPLAYILSGTACVALIGFYLAGMLRSRKPALAFSGAIGLLYAVLYGVLQSEDNALLMGALIIFTAVAAVMALTRHMDWYRLGNEREAPAA